MQSDTEIEKKRYEARAKLLEGTCGAVGFDLGPKYLHAPYECYQRYISSTCRPGVKVLEIGAGTGEWTWCLLNTGATVVAMDISQSSLDVLRDRYSESKTLVIKAGDIESLPFSIEEFDIVVSAGVLSYGDNSTVQAEIFRVLKPDGIFVCIDSLNHNPIYRINRWAHFIKGNRTRSTLYRMPTISLLRKYESCFGLADIRFFGSLCWLAPFVSLLCGQDAASRFVAWFDCLIGVRLSAFKFVMLARKINNE